MKGFGNEYENKKQNSKTKIYKNTEKLINQAFLSHSKGNIKDAFKYYKYCIEAGVNDYRIFSNCGLILKNSGNLIQAEKLLRKAIEINPNSDSAHTNLGSILKDLKKFNEAELYHRKAIEINPNFSLAYVNLGNVLRELKKFQEAEIMLRKAIQIDPRSSIAHANLGDILKNKGQLAEAKILLRKAIEINPSLVKAFYSLSKLSFNSDDISWQKYLLSEKILEQKNEKDKIEIYFARSNVLHKEKRYEESAENLQIANQLKLKIYPSNIDTLINRSNLLLNKSNTGKNHKNEKKYPCSIFIVGMPRSGTTLVESIISLNEKVQDLGEINIFEKAYQESIKNDQELSLTDLYFQKIEELGINSSITTNKWLYNYLYAGIIANQISNSKIIHCLRNPLDNILSITRANFSTGNSYSSSLVDCTKVYINQKKVMNTYKNLFSSSIYEMDYDLLVTNPEPTIKSLIKWLGWQWNENYLSPHKNQRTVLTASDVQIRSPINPKSIGGWKNYKNMLKPAISILSKTDQFKDLIS